MEESPLPQHTPGSAKPISDRIKAAFAQRNYELIGELGRGGMGVVYLAQHRKLGRRVALKTLTPERQGKDNSVKRFVREARTFAQIRHPHIANLYEFEDSGPIQFLALEYIEGTDLEKERRRNRKWSYEEVARLISSVADALDHTHKKGILHRDIKPGNILIERNTNRVVLTDFGLAKSEQDDTLTASGFAVGTPAYMAPEQITDQFGVKPDGRADLFSLGTVAYEMLTLRHPFLASDDLNTMRNIVNGKITPMRDFDPQIPEALCRIIDGLLVRNPKERIPDAATLVKRLNDWLAGREGASEAATAPPRQAEPAAIPAPAQPPAGNTGLTTTQIILIVAGVGLVSMILGAIVMVLVLR